MVHPALLRLERNKDRFGAPFAARKLAALNELARTALPTARQVERLHEALCFLRAYPDDPAVLGAVRRMLDGFAARADLRRHRDALAHTGIAGTTSWFPFFFPTAVWLVSRWPRQLRFDRNDTEAGTALAQALPLLVAPLEATALRAAPIDGFAAVDRLRARGETDATFLVRRVLALPGDESTRAAFYDAINPSCELLPAMDAPSRTHAHEPRAPHAFRTTPLRRARPDLHAQLARPPRAVETLGPAQGHRIIDLARGAMATRQRDLDAFAYGDPRAVLQVDDGDGLAFGFNGMVPAQRAPIAAVFGGLVLQNGVPTGYVQADCVGAHAALSFNTFATFRGGESAHTFARLLAVLHHVFGATAFSIEPYQLGDHNEEGLATGAWWFYFKLGFRPRDFATRRIVAGELARMRRSAGHRSSRAVLQQLARHHLFFAVDARARGFLPPLAQIGWHAARVLADLAGADRQRAIGQCERAALERTGLNSLRGFDGDERRAWSQWAPLLVLLPLELWPVPERAALVALIRAKGGANEREYVTRFAAHARLQRDLWKIGARRAGRA